MVDKKIVIIIALILLNIVSIQVIFNSNYGIEKTEWYDLFICIDNYNSTNYTVKIYSDGELLITHTFINNEGRKNNSVNHHTEVLFEKEGNHIYTVYEELRNTMVSRLYEVRGVTSLVIRVYEERVEFDVIDGACN